MMMMEKEEMLGLSLGLTSSSSSSSSSTSISPHQLTLMPCSSPATALLHAFPFPCHQKTLLSADPLFSHSDKRRPTLGACRGKGEATRPLLRWIDMNQSPSSGMALAGERDNWEDGAGACSPNSTVSSPAGAQKSVERDHFGQCIISGPGDDNDAERASSRGPASDEEDGEGARKKLRLSKDQSAVLEESFKEHNTLNPKQKLALAKQLNLRPRQIEVWFQNRRARTKLKQTEVDCELLKRCCENLTEENRRLQKEVQELRALKLSPQLYMHMTPPTTLTICPSCERVSNSGTMTSAAATTCTTSKSSSSAPEQHQFLLQNRSLTLPWAQSISLHPQKS